MPNGEGGDLPKVSGPEKPLVLRVGDPTAGKEFLQDPGKAHRKEVRQEVRAKTEARLDFLLHPEKLELTEDDPETEEAKKIHERIVIKGKRKDEKASLFRLINQELRAYDGLQEHELQGMHGRRIVVILREAREIITDAAKDEDVYARAQELLLEAQQNKDPDIVLTEIERLKTSSASLERKTTKVDKPDSDVPYWDFDGVVEEYVRVAGERSNLAILEVKGEGSTEEARKLKSDILLYGWGTPPLNLSEKAKEWVRKGRPEAAYPGMAGETLPGMEEYSNVLTTLLGEFQAQRISFEQYLQGIQAQNQAMIEAFRREDPELERARWIDVAYRRGFWSHFTPQIEPEFFKKIQNEEERRLYEDRWQLHRAAFYKKSVHFAPDRFKDNQDLNQFSGEKIERVYNSPGVRPLLEEYIKVMYDGAAIRLYNEQGNPIMTPDLDEHGNQRTDAHGNPAYVQRKMAFWDIESEQDLEDFRTTMRRRVLLSNPDFRQQLVRSIENSTDNPQQRAERIGKLNLNVEAKQADAVVLDLMYVGNLVESLDSRYSWGGKRHDSFPLMMLASDDARLILHPQEKWEGKIESRHFDFGPLVRWGVNFVDPIREQNTVVFNKGTDRERKVEPKIIWKPARTPVEYWTYGVVKDEDGEDKRTKEGGKIVVIRAPEAYPITAFESFFERYQVEDENGSRNSSLEHLRAGRKINWKTVEADFGDYNGVRFNKAVLYYQYYKGDVPMEIHKPGGVITWTKPIMEFRNRMRQETLIKRVKQAGKTTYQTDKNLRVWGVVASTGGVYNAKDRVPQMNLTFTEKIDVGGALRDRNVGYLQRGEELGID